MVCNHSTCGLYKSVSSNLITTATLNEITCEKNMTAVCILQLSAVCMISTMEHPNSYAAQQNNIGIMGEKTKKHIHIMNGLS